MILLKNTALKVINKKTAYRIFQIAWLYFLIAGIADFRLNRNIDLIPFIHVSEIPLIRFLPFILFALFLIPYKEVLNLFKEKKNVIVITLLVLLLCTGYISSYFSKYPETALRVCGRFAYYIAAFIFLMAAVRYFENAKAFLIKSFIYSNVLVIGGSILDFYSPTFHEMLTKHFDRPETFHSVVKLSGETIMRPMGFLTDSNLTAFSISIALILLLFNYKQFNRVFRYSFYILSSFCIGMLASRAGLLICIISAAVFYFRNLVEKKELYLFFAAFVIFQLITPQTYYRIYTFLDKKQNRMEFSTGRFLLWETAFTVFKENPVIGAGPGVFFELSDSYIRKSIIERYNINIDNPFEPDYFKIDKKNPHNIFLVMLAETGLIGFSLFLTLIFYLLYLYIKQKKYISLLFLINILIVSSVSNFAPYYKFYLVICMVFFITSEIDMKIDSKGNKNV